MHKYSYELSASYRNETNFENNYVSPPSSKRHSATFYLPSKPVSSCQRGYSKAFTRNKNIQIPSYSQSITHGNNIKTTFDRSRSGLITQQPSPRPEHIPYWRHPQQKSVQNRLKILADLGERHEYALRCTNYQVNNKGYIPSNKLDHQNLNQNREDLKRQFNFKNIAVYQQHRPTSQFTKNGPIEVVPLGSKQSMLNMAISNYPRKSAQATQIVAKVSSLQQRIRSTVSPYYKK